MKFTEKDLLLYAVTDRSWLGEKTLYQQVEEAIKGGVTFVQLREKKANPEDFLKEAVELKKLCQAHHVPFVINDNVSVALASKADGVHLGQEDMTLQEARAALGPDKIIGVSAHSVEEALLAEKNGADYLGVGAIFSTTSKSDVQNTSIQVLKDICQAVSIPVIAIGGISPENLLLLKDSGIRGAAVISALFAKPNVEQAARQLQELLLEIV